MFLKLTAAAGCSHKSKWKISLCFALNCAVVPPWHRRTGCRRFQTSSWASAPWCCRCRQTLTDLLPKQTLRRQSNTVMWRTLKKKKAKIPESMPCHTSHTVILCYEFFSSLTHLPLADCLAVILSVSLRPISRSWRPDTEPVCVAVCGFQKEISPFRVATANSWPSGR